MTEPQTKFYDCPQCHALINMSWCPNCGFNEPGRVGEGRENEKSAQETYADFENRTYLKMYRKIYGG